MKISLINGKVASDVEIQHLEEAIQHPVNDMVKEFFLQFDGAKADDNIFPVGKNNNSGVHCFIPVFEILEKSKYIGNLGKASYPIAYDEGGNFVIVDESRGGEIYFWDHDWQDRSIKLADNFYLFLEMLEPFDVNNVDVELDGDGSVWIDPEFEKEMIEKGFLKKNQGNLRITKLR